MIKVALFTLHSLTRYYSSTPLPVREETPDNFPGPKAILFYFFFFRLSFRNCISCVNNCEDLLYIYLQYSLIDIQLILKAKF